MPLATGDKLDRYEILALIGNGGMGEVWKAHDPRLNRDVAIKVSAQQFTDRFDREAHAIAALNHTNICTLYDVGPNYLVMEFIEGPTLADRIAEGPIPLDEALGYAKQIAAALEAAHEKPIVHRDLKPANVKIRPDGSVKVLDFGLATAVEEVEVTPDSPTMMPGTHVGVILGTAGYMSPEQARGKKVDKRADIWAFGVVLYEMLTGRRLFQGEDVTETMASVVKEKPDLSGVPAQVLPLLNRCLEKDPNNRLRDIGDAWALLGSGAVSSAPSQSRLGMGLGWIAAGALAVVAVVALWAPWRAQKPVDRPLIRLDVDLGADVSVPAANAANPLAISPDGTRLVYASGTPARLFTRRLDQAKATELPGTQGAAGPFFSPDGQWVGFSLGGKLNKISVEGGAVVPLADVIGFGGASWGEDGNILVSDARKGLVRVPAGGGPPQMVVDVLKGEYALASPQILPGGKAILFASYATRSADTASVQALILADHHRKVVVQGGTSPRYLATQNGAGYLLYTNRATLFAVPFDPDKLETRGTAAPMLDDVAHSPVGSAHLEISRTGALVYRRGGGDTGLLTVTWIEGAGKTEPLLAKPGLYDRPELSPDGQRLAVDVTEASGQDIWVYDWKRDTMTRLSFTGTAFSPIWSPDGRYIAWGSSAQGMFAARSDGAGQPQPLTRSTDQQSPWSFTPDGRQLAFQDRSSKSGYDLWTVPIESDGAGLRAGTPVVFLQTPASERHPALSPDGRWLAYSSDESGTFQVYVRAFPDKGGKWQISSGGGTYPMWSRNGHELFFETMDGRIMLARYTVKGDSFAADKPLLWSDRKLGAVGGVGTARNVTLAPDGKRFAALMPAAAPETEHAQNQVVFLLNFSDELRRRFPAGK
ncbi:MAG: protein kinase [Bryobacteraceae bacterium]|jgi:serine/threonine-protein kinase